MANQQALQQMEAMARGVLDPNNEVRGRAQAAYEQCLSSNPALLLTSLAGLLGHGDPQVSQFCGVMLRQACRFSPMVPAAEQPWPRAGPQAQAVVKQALMERFQNEKNASMRRKISDVIGVLGAMIYAPRDPPIPALGEWNELMPTLSRVAQMPSAPHRASVLDIFAVLAEYAFPVIEPQMQMMKAVIHSGLSDANNIQVRLSALQCLYSVLLSLLEDNRREPFVDLVPLVFKNLTELCAARRDDDIREVMDTLDDIAEHLPRYFRTHITAVVGVMVQIASSGNLEPATRRLGLSFLMTLLQHGRGMVRAQPEFRKAAVNLAFQYMLRDIGEFPLERWTMSVDEDYLELADFSMGVEAIDTLAMHMGGKNFLVEAMPIVQQFSRDENWVKRHAAMMCISECAEGCKKQFQDKLPDLLSMLVPHIKNDPHPRVRWAALNALAQFCVDFAPGLEKNFHGLVMPLIASVMNSQEQNPRVSRHAALCVVDYAEQCQDNPEWLEPYVPALMGNVMKLLATNNVKLQDSAVVAVSAIAKAVGKSFTPYYDGFMPGLLSIVTGATSKELAELCGRSIECVGCIAVAVGKEKFGPDAARVMDLLAAIQKQGLEADDPRATHLVQAFARVCQCMGKAFVPYLQFVIPPLLRAAAAEGAFMIGEDDMAHPMLNKPGFETAEVSIRSIAKQKLLFNTTILEEKALACNMLFQYAEELEEGFFPFVEQTVRILTPLVRYRYNEAVRIASTNAMPMLVKSAVQHVKKNGGNGDFVKQMWGHVLQPLLEAVKLEPDIDTLNSTLFCLSESIECLNFPVPPKHAEVIVSLLQFMLNEANMRMMERLEEQKSPDFDEEEAEVQADAAEADCDHILQMANVVRALAQSLKDQFVPLFKNTLEKTFSTLLQPSYPSGMREAGLSVFCSVVEHCGQAGLPYTQSIFPFCLRYAQDPEGSVRQWALYGVGICGQVGGSAFKPAVQGALQLILSTIRAPNARDDDNEAATDNAVSSLGKLCKYQSDSVNVAELLPLWLSYLPMKADALEGQKMHEDLVAHVERSNPHILGQNHSNLPRILAVLTDILETDMTNDELTARIVRLWMSFRAKLPQDVCQQLYGGLGAERQHKLEKAIQMMQQH